MSVETDFLPTSSDLPNHVMAMFWTEISFFTSENLKIRCNIVHQTRWGSQIIPQKYYKNQIELDHNFVLYEPFQILTQQNKEGQIYRFVENPEIEWRIEISNVVINLRNLEAIWAALHNSIIKALFGRLSGFGTDGPAFFNFSFIWH